MNGMSEKEERDQRNHEAYAEFIEEYPNVPLADGFCNRCGVFGLASAGCSHVSCGGIFVKKEESDD